VTHSAPGTQAAELARALSSGEDLERQLAALRADAEAAQRAAADREAELERRLKVRPYAHAGDAGRYAWPPV
jgi:hypothetical protein